MRVSAFLGLLFLALACAVHAQTDLAITKSDGQDPVALGTNIVYAIFLINNGPGQATNVVLTDALPSSVTFSSMDAPENWTCNTPQVDTSGIVNCSNSGVSPGETVGFTLTVRPTAAGVITNTVSTTSSEPDSNMENNTQTQQTTVITTEKPSE
jgi:uncharacterized repeat protein (TIGR01451 family)